MPAASSPLNWRECAEYYLKEVWAPHDRKLIRDFSARKVTCEVVHDLCVRYSVARTIPGHYEEVGAEKYRPFVNMLNRYRDAIMTKDNVPDIIDREVANMRKYYKGRTFESAISKAFWMMKQHPIVIYDTFAWYGLQRVGLKPSDYSYRTYFNSWFRFFEQKLTQIALDDAVKHLTGLPYTQEPIRAGTITAADLESAWFRNRVTDMRLAFVGGWEL
jgi:hypothetical protein